MSLTKLETEILNSYPGSEEICAFIDQCESNPNEVRRCDGGLAAYFWCLRVVDMDKSIFKYGSNSWANYEGAKQTMRRALKIIRTYKRNKE